MSDKYRRVNDGCMYRQWCDDDEQAFRIIAVLSYPLIHIVVVVVVLLMICDARPLTPAIFFFITGNSTCHL